MRHIPKPKRKLVYWALGTALASLFPIALTVPTTLLSEERMPSWSELCNRGDLILVAAVLTIGASVELIYSIAQNEIAEKKINRSGLLAVAGIILLLTHIFIYVIDIFLTLHSKHDRGSTTAINTTLSTIQWVVDVVSPGFLLVAIILGAVAVQLTTKESG